MNKMRKQLLKKRNLLILLALVLAAMAGTTAAWLIGGDKVTNTVTGKDISIALLEPEWDASGREEALKLEPGMTVKKDPYVLNTSDSSVYVRMQIILVDKEGKDLSKENPERYRNILKALYDLEEGQEAKKLVTFPDGDSIESASSSFFYKDGWFYFGTVNEEGKPVYTPLEAGASTPTLFDELRIPVYRKSARTALHDSELEIYETVFDTPFSIDIIAQAISAKTADDAVTKAFEALT